MSKPLTESVHCYLDSARGQYIPRDFARDTKRDCIEGVKAEDLDYLARGPGGCLDEDRTLADGETERGEFYWDTWQTVLDNAILTDPQSGLRFRLHQDGDLFLVPEAWEWNEDTEGFEPPESDTLRRFELPVYWASCLINGDDSGTDEKELAAINAFIAKEDLQGWHCTEVSERSWFQWGNDGTNLGCETARFTFVNFASKSPAKV